MKGNFTVHFFDLIIYLVPGMIVAYFGGLAISGCYKGSLWYHTFSSTEGIVAFLLTSYIIGHSIHTLSYVVEKIDNYFRGNSLPAILETLAFKEELKNLLRKKLSISKLSDREAFYFSVRIVSEYMPVSNQTTDRQLAIMLFCRSIILGLAASELFIVILLISSFKGVLIILVVLIPVLLIVNYKRFTQMRTSYYITTYRSCYLWLTENKE